MTWADVCREIHFRPKGARRAGWADGMRVVSARFDSRNTDPHSPYYRKWDFANSYDFCAPPEVFAHGRAMGYGNPVIEDLYCQYSISADWEWII